MSSHRSVDRSAVTHEIGRSAVAQEVDRSAVARENARALLCRFTLAGSRRCRTPRSSTHPHFRFYNSRKEPQVKFLVSVSSAHSVLKSP